MAFIDLTNVANVNNWLPQAAGTDAALIQSAITNFSRYVLTRTGRAYLGGFQSYTERYNGNGSYRLQLRNYPILSVSSLSISGRVIPQSPDFQQFGWVIDTSGSQSAIALIASDWVGGIQNQRGTWGSYGNAPALGQAAGSFWEGVQNVAVSYTAGQVTTQWYESATVPGVSPYTVTVANAATFWQDEGATLANGTTLAGSYTVTAGVYTFTAAQAGDSVLISYQYGAVPEDLQQMATEIVAVNYKRRKWLDQVSQMQPGVGTTSYSRLEMPPECTAILQRYERKFVDS